MSRKVSPNEKANHGGGADGNCGGKMNDKTSAMRSKIKMECEARMISLSCKYCEIKKSSARGLRCHLQACSKRTAPIEKGTEAKIKIEFNNLTARKEQHVIRHF